MKYLQVYYPIRPRKDIQIIDYVHAGFHEYARRDSQFVLDLMTRLGLNSHALDTAALTEELDELVENFGPRQEPDATHERSCAILEAVRDASLAPILS